MKLEDLVTFDVNGKRCVALVRKMTECECFRLMGVGDKDIGTILDCGVSRSSMYKMAGNSIVVDVLYHIFRTAFIPSERGDCGDLFGASNLISGEFTKERPLRVATLCSGYDSQFMALERLHEHYPDFHYERVWFAEFDPESNKPIDEQPAVVAHNALWPNCPNLGDMTKIDWGGAREKYGDIDLLFYSTPCQSISQAGLQHGFKEGSGTRSSIIWNVRDALRILQPRFACLENVAAMVSAKFKPMFDLWRQTTVDLGYASFSKMLNAKNYGVPQNRERIFLFSVHKDKNGGDANYNFPRPIPLERMLQDLLEICHDTRYYLNPIKVQEFAKANVGKIAEYAKKRVDGGCVIEKLPSNLREWLVGYEQKGEAECS